MLNAKISGIASFVPEFKLTNDDGLPLAWESKSVAYLKSLKPARPTWESRL